MFVPYDLKKEENRYTTITILQDYMHYWAVLHQNDQKVTLQRCIYYTCQSQSSKINLK